MKKLFLVLFIFSIACISHAQAQNQTLSTKKLGHDSLTLIIIDKNQKPIEGAKVNLNGMPTWGTTRIDGSVLLPVDSGNYNYYVLVSYKNDTVPQRASASLFGGLGALRLIFDPGTNKK